MLKYISLVVLLKGGNRCSGISPTKKGSEGYLLFAVNGEPLLFCAAFRNEDNLSLLARKHEGRSGHRLGKIDALATLPVDFHNAVALTNGEFRIPHNASYDGAICRDGRHDFPFGLVDLEGFFLLRMRQEVERATGKVNRYIAIVEEH